MMLTCFECTQSGLRTVPLAEHGGAAGPVAMRLCLPCFNYRGLTHVGTMSADAFANKYGIGAETSEPLSGRTATAAGVTLQRVRKPVLYAGMVTGDTWDIVDNDDGVSVVSPTNTTTTTQTTVSVAATTSRKSDEKEEEEEKNQKKIRTSSTVYYKWPWPVRDHVTPMADAMAAKAARAAKATTSKAVTVGGGGGGTVHKGTKRAHDKVDNSDDGDDGDVDEAKKHNIDGDDVVEVRVAKRQTLVDETCTTFAFGDIVDTLWITDTGPKYFAARVVGRCCYKCGIESDEGTCSLIESTMCHHDDCGYLVDTDTDKREAIPASDVRARAVSDDTATVSASVKNNDKDADKDVDEAAVAAAASSKTALCDDAVAEHIEKVAKQHQSVPNPPIFFKQVAESDEVEAGAIAYAYIDGRLECVEVVNAHINVYSDDGTGKIRVKSMREVRCKYGDRIGETFIL